MAELPRLNGIIKALEEGGVAFVGAAPADGAAGTSAPYDGALFEIEHGPYDIRALQEGLQSMLDRHQIAQRGLAPAVTPIVRIPPNRSWTSSLRIILPVRESSTMPPFHHRCGAEANPTVVAQSVPNGRPPLGAFSCVAAAPRAQLGSRTGGWSEGAGAAEYPRVP